MNRRLRQFSSPEEIDRHFAETLIQTDVVLDIGCGIRPFSIFKPKVHLMAEPWDQYVPYLQSRFQAEAGAVPLRLTVPHDLRLLPDKSVDSVFMLDLIEHLEKDDGRAVLAEAERVARRQIAVFTPYGFLEQHYAPGDRDGWGLDNISLQTHRSGWLPEDFGEDWEFLVCDGYHGNKEFGAFYAIKTIERETRIPLQKKTLIASDLVLPDSALPQAAFTVDALKKVDPASYGLLTHRLFAAYNTLIVDDLRSYALDRLPASYFSLGSGPIGDDFRFSHSSPRSLKTLAQVEGIEARRRVGALHDLMVCERFERFVVLDAWGYYHYFAAMLSSIFGIDVMVIPVRDDDVRLITKTLGGFLRDSVTGTAHTADDVLKTLGGL
jgi:hypothetical protein